MKAEAICVTLNYVVWHLVDLRQNLVATSAHPFKLIALVDQCLLDTDASQVEIASHVLEVALKFGPARMVEHQDSRRFDRRNTFSAK